MDKAELRRQLRNCLLSLSDGQRAGKSKKAWVKPHNRRRGFYSAYRGKPEKHIYIDGKPARYMRTATVDREGKWNDRIASKSGIYVIKEGVKRHIYTTKRNYG